MTTNLVPAITIYTINRREPTLADKLLYTRKAVSRLLKIDYKDIEFIYVADDFVLVGLYNRSVKLDKREFKKMFVSERKARSQGLTATQHLDNGSQFTVRNHNNGHRYQVQLFSDGVTCQCADYQKQREALERGCCKHAYAVLNEFGLGSLFEYLESVKTGKIGSARSEFGSN